MLTSKKFICLILVVFYTAANAQHIPQTYIATKTSEPITIDGFANETAWQNAAWTNTFIDIEGVVQPKYDTQIKMIWDDENLYFFAKLKEPHIWGTLKERDTVVYYNNDFEIFIDPDGDTHNYYEFEVNVLNTVWDLFLSKPYRNGAKVLGDWDFKGLKSAIQINGTLNNPNDIDEEWTVEIAMPWAFTAPPAAKPKVPKNDFWRVNFSRVNWDFDLNGTTYSRKKDENGKFLREYNWVWSPQYVINMHEPEHWGYVYFADTANAQFIIPKDDYLKWYLYKLYRENRDSKSSKKLPPTTLFNKVITPHFQKETHGFILWARSPFTNKKLVIHDDGLFKTYD